MQSRISFSSTCTIFYTEKSKRNWSRCGKS